MTASAAALRQIRREVQTHTCLTCGEKAAKGRMYCAVCLARADYFIAQGNYYQTMDDPASTQVQIVAAWREYHRAFMAALAAVGTGK